MLIDDLTRTKSGRQAWHQEQLILEITDALCTRIAETKVTRRNLARRLGKPKSWLNEVLDGSRPITLRQLANILTALECKLRVNTVPF